MFAVDVLIEINQNVKYLGERLSYSKVVVRNTHTSDRVLYPVRRVVNNELQAGTGTN